MSGPFLFLTRPGGGPIDEDTCRAFDAVATRNELPPLTWVHESDYAVALGPDAAGLGTGPALCRGRWAHVVSNARLDDPDEVEELALHALQNSLATDPERLAGAIDVCGPRCIPDILGDFALVAWFPATRELHAARDAFGVRTLYYTERKDLLALSSNAALLAEGERYDREFMIDFLLTGFTRTRRTSFAGVSAIPPGGTAIVQRRQLRIERYWRPNVAGSGCVKRDDAAEAAGHFRILLEEAIRTRIVASGGNWAQLSGGLDSSSLVCMAADLHRRGSIAVPLEGTFTITESLSDESEYVDAVLARYPHRNVRLADRSAFLGDSDPPPMTDQPRRSYIFYAREREMAEALNTEGCRILLSGTGPDHWLDSNLYFFADALRPGAVFSTAREMIHWAALGRTSFYRFLIEHALMPNLPRQLRKAAARRNALLPAWLHPDTREPGLLDRLPEIRRCDGPHGQKYQAAIESQIEHLPFAVEFDLSSAFEYRFPFLSRPLVEHCVSLPPQFRRQPFRTKAVMRDALAGILPSTVATRVGKGGIGGRMLSSMQGQAAMLRELVRKPLLGDFELVDETRFRSAVEDACAGVPTNPMNSDPALVIGR